MIQYSPAPWVRCLLMFTLVGSSGDVLADLIPPGNKSVTHQLVFVDSPLLQSHRLIATPVRGFGGIEEVQAGRPFPFSSKYGTRLYVVPHDFVTPNRVRPGDRLPFPFSDVPVHSVTYVPKLSPVDSLLTTCKLVGIAEDQIQVEVIDHAELDRHGRPTSMVRTIVPLIAIAAAGLLGCVLLWKRTRKLT